MTSTEKKSIWDKGFKIGRAYPVERKTLSPSDRKFKMRLTPEGQHVFLNGIATGKSAQ